MTEPERQEAESRKYIAALVIPLKSGNYAVFDPSRNLVDVCSGYELTLVLHSINPDKWAAKVRKAMKPLDLEDLEL